MHLKSINNSLRDGGGTWEIHVLFICYKIYIVQSWQQRWSEGVLAVRNRAGIITLWEREKENSPVSLCEGEIFENDLQLSERFHKLGKHPAFMCNMDSVFHSLTCRLDSYLQWSHCVEIWTLLLPRPRQFSLSTCQEGKSVTPLNNIGVQKQPEY